MIRYALAALLLTGCSDNGRYQIAAGDGSTVWRLDTRTGDLRRCYMANMESITCLPPPAWLKDSIIVVPGK